ncbi:MAG: thiamine phosphate synthase [Phycisphaerales bacterium]
MSRNARRILDASANRAREALRVLEDAARFTLDDDALTQRCKTLRHDLRAALDALPGGQLQSVAHRDTAGDVGTAATTDAERTRAGLRDVVIAAGKRLTESLRSIEEIAKTLDPSVAPRFESLRYRAYDLDRDLTLAMGAAPADFTGWRCCVLLTESICALPWREVAERAIDAGADCIQLREKLLPDRDLLARARELIELARGRADIVVNDRPDIALLAGARGVHLGQDDMAVADARRLAGSELLVGVSTANLEQARRARSDGADICGAGPMFLSATKPKPALAGPAYLREYLACHPPLPPVLAISAITPERIADLRAAAEGRPFGVAVSGAVCGSPDPGEAVRALLAALDGATTRAPV